MGPSPDVRNVLLGWDVSRETIERLTLYEALLSRWQPVKNLIGRSTLDEIWQRHFVDSLQVYVLRSTARHWIDLGSGAGFPGLVVAICQVGRIDSQVDLIEADHRKCAFLRHVSRETGANVRVHHGRIEEVLQDLPVPDVITARALAPMDQLLEWTGNKVDKGATGLFLKGQDIGQELTSSSKSSKYNIELIDSQTSPTGKIVVVTGRRQVPG